MNSESSTSLARKMILLATALLAVPILEERDAFPQQVRQPQRANLAEAQPGGETADLLSPAEMIVSPVRLAWCSPLSPDETWIVTGYGSWNGAGQVRVCDLTTGELRWLAKEDRGVRT